MCRGVGGVLPMVTHEMVTCEMVAWVTWALCLVVQPLSASQAASHVFMVQAADEEVGHGRAFQRNASSQPLCVKT